jgi:AmmeMemoRadiSam system protein A
MNLTESDKALLLSMARRTIAQCITREAGTVSLSQQELTDGIKQHCGAFVSIYVNGKLRGCIGTFSEEAPLYENVRQMAVSAATSDNRFSPVKYDELEIMQLEISVLTPRKRIEDKQEIVLGRHGIYMIRGGNRGTLLPQVAVKQGWSVEELLGNCAKYKAGIGWDGWKTAELYTYEAIVFHTGADGPGC